MSKRPRLDGCDGLPQCDDVLVDGASLAEAKPGGSVNGGDDAWVESAFASRYLSQSVPKNRMPDGSMPASVAYQLIKDLRNLDCNPRLNLASFVTTWMEPEAIKLIKESLDINYVDMEEYPSSTEIQNRCVSMLSSLYNSPCPQPCGTACLGSSEAIMLAGLSMKKRWEAQRKAQGLPTERPNLVMGYNVQVCWEKFCRYFDVEERFVPLTEECFVLRPDKAVEMVDENTIGVCGILGSTYTGEFEDIQELDRLIEINNKEKGFTTPIHVDAASGGFVAPFVYPELEWDFRLKNVISINVSGHKYGLVYPGLGWVIWREPEYLHESLVFHTNYLGSDQPSVTLNFSKGASMIIAQYYQFLRLGREGYRKIMLNLKMVARELAKGLEETGHFRMLSNSTSLPLVAFSLKPRVDDEGKEHPRVYDEFDVADRLKMRGWVLPAYSMAPNAQSVKLLRAVVREDLSVAMAQELVNDIHRAVEWLDDHFTFSRKQLESLKSRFQLHRMDSNIMRKVKMSGVC